MPPLPKKKHSRARKGFRRSHKALSLPALSVCPCSRKLRVPPHQACPECGNYKGRTMPGSWELDNIMTVSGRPSAAGAARPSAPAAPSTESPAGA